VPTISERLSSSRFVSIELLPPRTPTVEEALAAAVQELAPLNPAFVAVTYGVNGSDRGRTEALVEQLAGSEALPLPQQRASRHPAGCAHRRPLGRRHPGPRAYRELFRPGAAEAPTVHGVRS
jgi:hypothetical protein